MNQCFLQMFRKSNTGHLQECLFSGGGRTVGGVQQSQNQSGAFNFSPIGSPPMSGLISPPPLLVPTMPMYNQNSGNTSLGYQMDGSQTSGFVPVPIYNMQG